MAKDWISFINQDLFFPSCQMMEEKKDIQYSLFQQYFQDVFCQIFANIEEKNYWSLHIHTNTINEDWLQL